MTPVERLARLLQALGFRVWRIDPVQGGQRRLDTVRWTAGASFQGRNVILSSWDTVTTCARRGITVAANFDVSARGEP